MRTYERILTAGLLAVFPTTALADETTWIADYDEAARIAKEQKKDLLVDFTGSDWCGWCIRLDKEVFAHEAFLEPATKDYVLVKLDFPRGEDAKAKVPNPKRNDELKNQHQIQGFPTILLMTADGFVYGQTGYQQGGPEKYIEHLTEFRADGRAKVVEAKQRLEELEKATGDAREAMRLRILGQVEGMEADDLRGSVLAAAVRPYLESDADNAQGLKLRAIQVLMKFGQQDDAVTAAARELDPKNEHGLLERLVLAQVQGVASEAEVEPASEAIDALLAHGEIKDDEVALEIYTAGAFFNARFLNDNDKAKRFAAKAKPLAKEGDPRISFLDEVLNS